MPCATLASANLHQDDSDVLEVTIEMDTKVGCTETFSIEKVLSTSILTTTTATDALGSTVMWFGTLNSTVAEKEQVPPTLLSSSSPLSPPTFFTTYPLLNSDPIVITVRSGAPIFGERLARMPMRGTGRLHRDTMPFTFGVSTMVTSSSNERNIINEIIRIVSSSNDSNAMVDYDSDGDYDSIYDTEFYETLSPEIQERLAAFKQPSCGELKHPWSGESTVDSPFITSRPVPATPLQSPYYAKLTRPIGYNGRGRQLGLFVGDVPPGVPSADRLDYLMSSVNVSRGEIVFVPEMITRWALSIFAPWVVTAGPGRTRPPSTPFAPIAAQEPVRIMHLLIATIEHAYNLTTPETIAGENLLLGTCDFNNRKHLIELYEKVLWLQDNLSIPLDDLDRMLVSMILNNVIINLNVDAATAAAAAPPIEQLPIPPELILGLYGDFMRFVRSIINVIGGTWQRGGELRFGSVFSTAFSRPLFEVARWYYDNELWSDGGCSSAIDHSGGGGLASCVTELDWKWLMSSNSSASSLPSSLEALREIIQGRTRTPGGDFINFLLGGRLFNGADMTSSPTGNSRWEESRCGVGSEPMVAHIPGVSYFQSSSLLGGESSRRIEDVFFDYLFNPDALKAGVAHVTPELSEVPEDEECLYITSWECSSQKGSSSSMGIDRRVQRETQSDYPYTKLYRSVSVPGTVGEEVILPHFNMEFQAGAHTARSVHDIYNIPISSGRGGVEQIAAAAAAGASDVASRFLRVQISDGSHTSGRVDRGGFYERTVVMETVGAPIAPGLADVYSVDAATAAAGDALDFAIVDKSSNSFRTTNSGVEIANPYRKLAQENTGVGGGNFLSADNSHLTIPLSSVVLSKFFRIYRPVDLRTQKRFLTVGANEIETHLHTGCGGLGYHSTTGGRAGSHLRRIAEHRKKPFLDRPIGNDTNSSFNIFYRYNASRSNLMTEPWNQDIGTTHELVRNGGTCNPGGGMKSAISQRGCVRSIAPCDLYGELFGWGMAKSAKAFERAQRKKFVAALEKYHAEDTSSLVCPVLVVSDNGDSFDNEGGVTVESTVLDDFVLLQRNKVLYDYNFYSDPYSTGSKSALIASLAPLARGGNPAGVAILKLIENAESEIEAAVAAAAAIGNSSSSNSSSSSSPITVGDSVYVRLLVDLYRWTFSARSDGGGGMQSVPRFILHTWAGADLTNTKVLQKQLRVLLLRYFSETVVAAGSLLTSQRKAGACGTSPFQGENSGGNGATGNSMSFIGGGAGVPTANMPRSMKEIMDPHGNSPYFPSVWNAIDMIKNSGGGGGVAAGAPLPPSSSSMQPTFGGGAAVITNVFSIGAVSSANAKLLYPTFNSSFSILAAAAASSSFTVNGTANVLTFYNAQQSVIDGTLGKWVIEGRRGLYHEGGGGLRMAADSFLEPRKITIKVQINISGLPTVLSPPVRNIDDDAASPSPSPYLPVAAAAGTDDNYATTTGICSTLLPSSVSVRLWPEIPDINTNAPLIIMTSLPSVSTWRVAAGSSSRDGGRVSGLGFFNTSSGTAATTTTPVLTPKTVSMFTYIVCVPDMPGTICPKLDIGDVNSNSAKAGLWGIQLTELYPNGTTSGVNRTENIEQVCVATTMDGGGGDDVQWSAMGDSNGGAANFILNCTNAAGGPIIPFSSSIAASPNRVAGIKNAVRRMLISGTMRRALGIEEEGEDGVFAGIPSRVVSKIRIYILVWSMTKGSSSSWPPQLGADAGLRPSSFLDSRPTFAFTVPVAANENAMSSEEYGHTFTNQWSPLYFIGTAATNETFIHNIMTLPVAYPKAAIRLQKQLKGMSNRRNIKTNSGSVAAADKSSSSLSLLEESECRCLARKVLPAYVAAIGSGAYGNVDGMVSAMEYLGYTISADREMWSAKREPPQSGGTSSSKTLTDMYQFCLPNSFAIARDVAVGDISPPSSLLYGSSSAAAAAEEEDTNNGTNITTPAPTPFYSPPSPSNPPPPPLVIDCEWYNLICDAENGEIQTNPIFWVIVAIIGFILIKAIFSLRDTYKTNQSKKVQQQYRDNEKNQLYSRSSSSSRNRSMYLYTDDDTY